MVYSEFGPQWVRPSEFGPRLVRTLVSSAHAILREGRRRGADGRRWAGEGGGSALSTRAVGVWEVDPDWDNWLSLTSQAGRVRPGTADRESLRWALVPRPETTAQGWTSTTSWEGMEFWRRDNGSVGTVKQLCVPKVLWLTTALDPSPLRSVFNNMSIHCRTSLWVYKGL